MGIRSPPWISNRRVDVIISSFVWSETSFWAEEQTVHSNLMKLLWIITRAPTQYPTDGCLVQSEVRIIKHWQKKKRSSLHALHFQYITVYRLKIVLSLTQLFYAYEALCNVRRFISVRVRVGLFTRELSINDYSIVLCFIHCLSNSIGHMSIIIAMTK